MLSRILTFLLLALSAGCSWIGGWFGGSESVIPPSELKTLNATVTIQQLWETKVGAGAENQFIRLIPALVDGRVYAASHDGTVMALDALTGQRVWATETQLPISGGVGTSDNGLVLVGTDKGQVVALHQSDGREAWRTTVSSEVLAAPRGSRGIVVIRTGDGKFTGVDASSGERRWVSSHTMPILSLRGNSSPLLVQNLVIAGLATGKLLVLSLDKGLPMAEKTVAPPHGRTEIERLIDIDAEPKVFGDILYLAAYRGSVAAIDMRGGNQLWNRPLSSYAGLDVDARQVYVSDDTDAVVALDRRDGNALWKQADLTGRRLTAPATSDDYVVVGDFEGYLHWLDKNDGRIVGRIRAAGKEIITPPLTAGNTVFMYSKNGVLSAFRAGG